MIFTYCNALKFWSTLCICFKEIIVNCYLKVSKIHFRRTVTWRWAIFTESTTSSSKWPSVDLHSFPPNGLRSSTTESIPRRKRASAPARSWPLSFPSFSSSYSLLSSLFWCTRMEKDVLPIKGELNYKFIPMALPDFVFTNNFFRASLLCAFLASRCYSLFILNVFVYHKSSPCSVVPHIAFILWSRRPFNSESEGSQYAT